MNLLNKLTVKNLKLNKKRTIVTIVGIMLSAALITAVAAVYASAVESLINYEIIEKGNFHFAFYDMPVDEAKELYHTRGVDVVSMTQDLGYAEVDSQNEFKPYVFVKGFTREAMENLSVRLIEGRLPENSSEILIPSHLMTNGRVTFAVGDEITFNIGKRVSEDGVELGQFTPLMVHEEDDTLAEHVEDTTPVTYTVTGLIERPAENIEGYSAPGYTVITWADENTLSGNVNAYVHLSKAKAKNVFLIAAGILGIDENLAEKILKGDELSSEEMLKAGLEAVKMKYTFDFNYYLIALENDPLSVSGINTLSYAVYVVLAIILVTSIFCIKNSFDISITEKIRQYGMLRSIGATKHQIRKNVFFEATIFGLIGIPCGILVGLLAACILVRITDFFMTDLAVYGFRAAFAFSWWAVIAAVVLGVVTIYFSAFRSAIKASRVSPIDSIRSAGDVKIKRSGVKAPGIIRKIFGIGGEISYKNLKRSKKKYRTTVISIIVSVVVFISLYSFMSMEFAELNRDLERTEYNISLSLENPAFFDEEVYQIMLETTRFDSVQEASVIREHGLEVTNARHSRDYMNFLDHIGVEQEDQNIQYFSLLAVGDEQFAKYCRSLGLNPADMKTKAILCDYIAISHSDEQGKNINKEMRLYDFQKGNVVECTDGSRIEIGAVSEEKPFGLKDWDGEFLFVSDELYDSMTDTSWVRIVYRTDDSTKLQKEIEEHLKGIAYHLSNIDENFRQANNLYTLVGIFLYGFIIVISLIGITNIFNTITTNMELRKREFATLRSVGMTNREFNRMIRLESLFMGTKSLMIGFPIGLVLSYILYRLLSEQSGAPYRLPVTALIISALVVFVLIFLIMLYSMGKIKKQNTIETIRNENI